MTKGAAVGRDSYPVADVPRAAVMIEGRVELAVDDQHRAGLGGEADVEAPAAIELVTTSARPSRRTW